MSKRNMASFSLSPLFLEEALQMPDGIQIVGAEWDFCARSVRLFVEGDGLPSVEIGQTVPSIVPIVTIRQGENDRPLHTWSWGGRDSLAVNGDRE